MAGMGKRHGRRTERLLLTAPAGRNNKVRVMAVVWLVKEGQKVQWGVRANETDNVMR